MFEASSVPEPNLGSARQTGVHPIRVGEQLDAGAMREIRRRMELRYFKWDAQVGDVMALAPAPLLMSSASWLKLATLAKRLFHETVAAEIELAGRPALYSRIGLPRAVARLMAELPPTEAAARVMRFDFHYTTDGWRISEVNSDVPGGFTEATNFTRLVAERVPRARPAGDPTQALVNGISRRTGERATILLPSAPGHMEDHQVVGHLATALRDRGFSARISAIHQLRWVG